MIDSVNILYIHGDLVQGERRREHMRCKRDLVQGKRDLVQGKRDLVQGERHREHMRSVLRRAKTGATSGLQLIP